ncbi:MAG: CDP-alcohol phosphatidyltransferase family protein [candidate division KSB1 bacterium]|nr:CDP-alcohol phosphatidyltransferase family protein [candidate division KSB1 bacterium]
MVRLLTWPNRVTVARIGLLFFLVVLVYDQNIWARLLAAVLAILVIVMDWLDGYLARKLDEATVLGSILDIAGDRMIESVLWIILADLRLVPVWIPIVVISRDILTDSIRGYALRFGYTAFGKTTMMRTPVGRFLTGSPWMRSSYAILKAFTFSWLLLFSFLDKLLARWALFPRSWIGTGLTLGYWVAVITALMCLVRGLPVIIEGVALIQRKEDEAAASGTG